MNDRPKRRTREFYIEKANKKHNHKYDYSKVVYEGVKKKVEIICPEHGSFWQNFDNHTNSGRGCPKCAGNIKKTTEDFIKEAESLHGNRYDYSKVNYKSTRKPVVIICKKHGEFKQMPIVHLRPAGCKKCVNDSRRVGDGQSFVDFCSNKYNNKYDYSLVDYKNENDKVAIICPSHGVFQQAPFNHRRLVVGCPKCSFENARSNKEDFIRQSVEVHGQGSYDYSNVDYSVNSEKVEITCQYGHTFWQTPANHLTGFGCNECASGWGGQGIYGTDFPSNLYLVSVGGSFLKVGLSKDTSIRFKALEKDTGEEIRLIKTVSGKASLLFELERTILRRSNLNKHSPRIKFAGYTECLELSEADKVLEIINDWEKENDGAV